MIHPRISAVWSPTKPIAPFSCTPHVQEVHTEAEVLHSTPRLKFNILKHWKCFGINHRISADWSTTKPIQPFSCTPRVQEVHTKDEVVHLTPGHQGLRVIFTTQA